MGFWIKYFADETKYIATDRDIKLRKSSWRNSRNTEIVKVELGHGNNRIALSGIGEYWQSDTMEVRLGDSSPTVVKRRIQKKIEDDDGCFYIEKGTGELVSSIVINPISYAIGQGVYLLNQQDKGKWFILELDVKNKAVTYYFSDVKI